jgi:hypothetical protein
MSEGSAEGEIYMDEDSFVMKAEINYTEHHITPTAKGQMKGPPRIEEESTPPSRTIPPPEERFQAGGEAFIYARPVPLGPVADRNGKMPMPDVGEKRELGQFKTLSKTVRPCHFD